MITYDHKSLIRIGKWSTHSFVDSPPADSAAWPDKVDVFVNIRVKLGKRSRTSYDPEQDHLCFHLCIHLNIGGNTEVNVEELNTGCSPGHMDLLCQVSC